MEQEGDGNKQNPQDQRQKEIEQVQQQQLQPQKCPRCESINTKFCYYNNYSLSQPRYFCKSCRRYWTQGGTLRNVPVGGGCRKGNKRAKNSSSSSSENSPQLPQPPPQEPNLTTAMSAKDPSSAVSISPFYQTGGGGGGYLASLAAMHSLSPSHHPFDQSLGSCSNLGLVPGLNVNSLVLQHQHQIRPSSQFNYQIGSDRESREVESLFSAEQGLISSSRMGNSSVPASNSHHDWPQSFININNANNNHGASDASLWSTVSTTSISGGNSAQNNNASDAAAAASASSSLIPNQWPGYGSPP